MKLSWKIVIVEILIIIGLSISLFRTKAPVLDTSQHDKERIVLLKQIDSLKIEGHKLKEEKDSIISSHEVELKHYINLPRTERVRVIQSFLGPVIDNGEEIVLNDAQMDSVVIIKKERDKYKRLYYVNESLLSIKIQTLLKQDTVIHKDGLHIIDLKIEVNSLEKKVKRNRRGFVIATGVAIISIVSNRLRR